MKGAMLLLAGLSRLAPAAVSAPAIEAPALAFHYGPEPPLEPIGFFPRVVLDPAVVAPGVVRALTAKGVRVLGRLPCRQEQAGPAAPPAPAVAPALLDACVERARALAELGYAGFLVEPGGAWSPPRLAELVHRIHARLPASQVLLEGGPEIAAGAAAELSGLVAGPLFAAFEPASGRYVAVPAAVREARIAALTTFARAWHVPIIDVEAVPPSLSRAEARSLASEIAGRGFTPWVAPAGRDRLGVGPIEAVPRRVLVVVDGAEEPYLPYAVAHRLLAMPLEYLGFAVDYADVRSPPFGQVGPTGPTGASEAGVRATPGEIYAGIVTWFTDDELPSPAGYERWFLRQIDAGVRVAVLGHLGFAPSQDFLRRLDIARAAHAPRPPLRIAAADAWLGFEAPPAARARDLATYAVPPALTRHLQLEDADAQPFSPVFEGSWGGMALDPYLTESGFEGRQRWIVDPFRFLASALDLPAIPIPDPTTENGRRLLEIHVDGDGFVSLAELPGHPLAGEVIRRDFLAPYRLPTTVSIIEGEIGPTGLYPGRAARLEAVAREIFALPEVEIASHTYSHPFDWLRAQGDRPRPGEPPADDETDNVDGDRLDIPGYTYALEREIDGSIHYIDRQLAPAGKTTRALLWSGNALPPEEAIARVDALGLENLNGDNAEQPGHALTLAGVPSFVRPVGARLQIYAPSQNENVYTNLWHGPFYGFRRVIDYFRFTETPRRLKPIGIYYHFYSGTKAASVKALHEVYDWAASQEVFPIWGSAYAARVRGFERATLARRLDGSWLLRDLGALRTVRLPAALGWPDLARSPDVVGVRDVPQGRYVALGAEPAGASPAGTPVVLSLTSEPPTLPYVEAANASVVSWRRQGAQLWFAVRGQVPAVITLGGCGPAQRLAVHAASLAGAGRELRFEAAASGEVHVACH